jgi:hypothetical protein
MIHQLPLGIADRSEAQADSRPGKGEVVFERVTFCYSAHVEPLFDGFSLRIGPASALVWWATPAPARPPSSSCCSGSTMWMAAAS